MRPSDRLRSERYLERAAELRTIATQIHTPELHERLIAAAEDYEKMAGRFAAPAVIRDPR